MILNNYELNLPSYSVGTEIYEHIKDKCTPYGKKAVVIGGKRAMEAARKKLEKAAGEADITILDYVIYGTECTYGAVEELKKLQVFKSADMVFAVGGGKAIDTCKCLCDITGKPIFTFPTVASNCAACTTVAVMYNEDNTFYKPHFFVKPPLHTFIDTEIISQAPAIYMWAGIGDTYAKYYEANISSRGEKLSHYTALGVNVSKMCIDALLHFAVQGYEDNKKKLCSYELEQTILAIIITTGIASIFLTRDFTPDYNSGLAHAICYDLTKYPVIEEKHYHGEMVGFGILIALLVDGQMDEFEKIYEFNKKLGLPIKLIDIDISLDEFMSETESIGTFPDLNHYPYKVTKKMLEEAIMKLENK